MATIEKTNEEKIFDAIQDLKDSLFGLKNSYANYCYSESSNGLYWNNNKSERFIEEIISQAKSTKTYNEEFEPIIRAALELSLKFILHACNFEEQQFVSLRKIIKTMEKDIEGEPSVFEIMVNRQKGYFDNIYLEKLEQFSLKMVGIDFEAFYKCCKHAIESFIDKNNLNSINSNRVTSEIVLRINRLSKITSSELRKYAEINGVFRDEE